MQANLTLDTRFSSSGVHWGNFSLALMIPLSCTLCHEPDNGFTDVVLPPHPVERVRLILVPCLKVFEVMEPPSSFDFHI